MLGAVFLSTSPLRGTTGRGGDVGGAEQISIHVPLAGDDRRRRRADGPDFGFLSTSPLRGTTKWPPSSPAEMRISIHVPLAGDDCVVLTTVS